MSPSPPSLSPSRANDFRQCPLLFRLRVIDRVPEPPSAAATLGTLVHAVLEHLYTVPAHERTVEYAHRVLPRQWEQMVEREPDLAGLHESDHALNRWLGEAKQRLTTYFDMENPQRLEPAATEQFVEYLLPDGPLLRGIIDRLDVAPDGSIRVVDYKTGKAPGERFRTSATFQMRFYALVVARLRQTAPSVLQLLYLKDGQAIAMRPTPSDLDLIEHEIRELWSEIRRAAQRGHFTPRRSKLCEWCSFQSLCPEFGGDPGPLDGDRVRLTVGVAPELGPEPTATP